MTLHKFNLQQNAFPTLPGPLVSRKDIADCVSEPPKKYITLQRQMLSAHVQFGFSDHRFRQFLNNKKITLYGCQRCCKTVTDYNNAIVEQVSKVSKWTAKRFSGERYFLLNTVNHVHYHPKALNRVRGKIRIALYSETMRC